MLGCRESDGKAVVVTVQEGGAAKRGGARQGMILVRINDDEANGFDQVVELLQKAARPMTIAFDDEKRYDPRAP